MHTTSTASKRRSKAAPPNKAAPKVIQAEVGEYLTTKEAADYLKVSKQFLEGARYDGSGPPYVQAGERVIRYRRPALDAYMIAREKAAK